MTDEGDASADSRDLPRYLSVRQVARYLQINEKKVYALASDGLLPGTKITGKWLFPRELVDQWLLENSHAGLLSDRLLITGSDDPLLHQVIGRLAEEVGAHALIGYTGTGTRLGLQLLAAGRADASCLHWGPLAESERRHPALLAGFPARSRWILVRAFTRQQGLMTTPGLFPAGTAPNALLALGHRWVFRQRGAGSQRFLRELLALTGTDEHSLDVHAVARSEREAATLIACGHGDIAPGVRAAAAEACLDFLPIGDEAFDIVVPRNIYFRTLFQHLLDAFRAPDIADAARMLGGYDLTDSGRLVWSPAGQSPGTERSGTGEP